MDVGCNWEHKTLINELTQGMELAKQLRYHLNSTSSSQAKELLIQRILSSFDKALLILKWRGSIGQSQLVEPTNFVPESSISADGSPRSGDFEGGFKDHQEHRDVSKKRKVLPTWTDQVRVCPENGLEGPNDDGYSWRKYGQKDILGATFPRSYYRCTYRSTQSCWATKQVQRSDEDPTIFEITYRGRHTCNQPANSVPPPPSPEKQELKHNNHQQQQQSNKTILNFRANLRVNTEESDNQDTTSPFTFPSASFGCVTSETQLCPFSTLDNGDLLGSFSPSFVSPTASGSNYLSVSHWQMKGSGRVHNRQHLECDLSDIISANTSATNSPIMDLDFSIDPANLDPNFPFNTSGFFN